MTTTTFVDKQTVIEATWLNDVDAATYQGIGDGTAAPTTPAMVRANLGLTASGGAALIGSVLPGTGAVARDIQRKLNDQVSVADFGAIPGVNTPAQIAINQAAFDAALAAYNNVYVPQGIWYIAGLAMPNKITCLHGDGPQISIINTTDPVGVYYYHFTNANLSSDSILSMLEIQCASTATALRVNNGTGIWADNLFVHGGEYGIELNNCNAKTWQNVYAYGGTAAMICRVAQTDVGTGASVRTNTFINLLLAGANSAGVNTGFGLFVPYYVASTEHLTRNTFINLDAEACTIGVQLEDGATAYDNAFMHTYMERNTSNNIQEGTGCRNYWFYPHVTPGGGGSGGVTTNTFSTLSQVVMYSNQYPAANGGCSIGEFQNYSGALYNVLGYAMVASTLNSGELALYDKNINQGQYSDPTYKAVVEQCCVGTTGAAAGYDVWRYDLQDSKGIGFVEVELVYELTVAKIKRSFISDGATFTFPDTIDTDTNTTGLVLAFASVSGTRFKFIVTSGSTTGKRFSTRTKIYAGAGKNSGVTGALVVYVGP